MLSVQSQDQITGLVQNMMPGQMGAKPQQRPEQRPERVDFYPYLKKLTGQLLERQQSLWRGDYMEWTRTALYYNGHQILTPNGQFGYNIQRLRGNNHKLYVFNKLRPASDIVTAAWAQAHPEVRFAVLEQQSRKARRAVWEIEDLNEYFNYLHFTEEVRQEIAKYGQFCGNYHAEVWWDDKDKRGHEWAEQWQNTQVPDQAGYQCLSPECGASGVMNDQQQSPLETLNYAEPKCPQCAAPVSLENQPGFEYPQKVSEGFQPSGEVGFALVPAYCMRYSRIRGPMQSPWRYVGQDEAKETLEFEYGILPTSATGENWAIDELMMPERILRRASQMDGNVEDDREAVCKQRFWLEPEMLNVELDRPATLPNGEALPMGTLLKDAFDGGMRITTVPGLPTFLEVERESHKKRFIDGRYGITTGSVVGHGVEDSVNNQKHYNVFRSGLANYFNKFLMPSVAVDSRVFPDKRLFNRNDPIIPTNIAMPDGLNVGQGYSIIQPPGINGNIWNLLELYAADIKEDAKAYDSQGDYVGAENSTATASRIGLGKSAMLMNLHLSLFAGWMKEVAIRRVEIARDNYGDKRLITVPSVSGDRNGRIARVLQAIHLRHSIMAWVKPGSYSPDLQSQKQEAAMARLNAQGMLMKIGMDSPQNRRVLDEVFQSDLGRESTASRVDACDDKLDEMIALFEQTQGQVMPVHLYSIRPVDIYEKDLDVRLDWWREWLGSPEGRGAAEVIREAVKMEIEQLWSGIGQQQMSFSGLPMPGAVAGSPAQAGGVSSALPMGAQSNNPGNDPAGAVAQGSMPQQ